MERWNLKEGGRKTFGAPHIWHRRGDLRGKVLLKTKIKGTCYFPAYISPKRLKMFVVDDPPFIDVDYGTGRIGGQNLEMPMELVCMGLFLASTRYFLTNFFSGKTHELHL